MMHTENLIYGVSMNPFNPERSCGGSSGGEAGLVASKCVPLGIGTDIGGSLRFPSTFCGIYGFKPTTNRLTRMGIAACRTNGFESFKHLIEVSGPLTTSVDDLVIGLKVFLDENIH
jgi:fatty acid amide hydrolase